MLGEVALIHWPDEAERLERTRRRGAPRLLLLGPGTEAPAVADPLEDWMRLPAPDDDLRARIRTLEARASTDVSPRVVDGTLAHHGTWVPLSPLEERLAGALTERFGAVVGREALMRAAWPDAPPSRNALDVHVLRLRRRIENLGLEIRTVRSRGYVLQMGNGQMARSQMARSQMARSS